MSVAPPLPDNRRRRAAGREWLRAALSPRMLAVMLLLLLAAGVCIRLGAWQLDRAAIRGAAEAETAHAERLTAEPAPIADVLPAQTSFPQDALARRVTAVGAYDPDQQVLVPDRTVDGRSATLVVTAFWVTEGPDAGAMLPVLRGWLPAEDVSVDAGQVRPVDTGAAAALAVPEGPREITGYLSGSEAAGQQGLPSGMLGAISAGQLANLWGAPSWSAYLVLAEETPSGSDLPPASPPSMAGETGLNLQNLAYAAEWWIFGGFALLLWWRMLRDEVVHRRQEAELLPV